MAETLRPLMSNDTSLVILPVDEGIANLYYLLGKLPPHYYLDFYTYFINDQTTQKWLDAVEQEQPKMLLYFPQRFDLATYSPRILEYVQVHYEVTKTISSEQGEVQVMMRKNGQ